MAKTTQKPKKPKVRKGDAVDKKRVVKDLNNVLKSHGLGAKIAQLSFTSTTAPPCTCPDGLTGVLKVVGGRLVCVCAH
jgi:hypothetical protein